MYYNICRKMTESHMYNIEGEKSDSQEHIHKFFFILNSKQDLLIAMVMKIKTMIMQHNLTCPGQYTTKTPAFSLTTFGQTLYNLVRLAFLVVDLTV